MKVLSLLIPMLLCADPFKDKFIEEISSDRHYYRHLLVDKEDQLLSTLLRRQTADSGDCRAEAEVFKATCGQRRNRIGFDAGRLMWPGLLLTWQYAAWTVQTLLIDTVY